jgi:hypothetical protein
MSTKAITPRLADRLCSLAESQLQTQAALSVSVDASALGVMAVDAALAAIIIGTRGAYELWILALILLGLSLSVAVRTLRLPAAGKTGPSIAAVRKAREQKDDDELEESLLDDLEADIEINEQALARKGPLFDRALTILVLALAIELAGALS